jgi:hypothetical protein
MTSLRFDDGAARHERTTGTPAHYGPAHHFIIEAA